MPVRCPSKGSILSSHWRRLANLLLKSDGSLRSGVLSAGYDRPTMPRARRINGVAEFPIAVVTSFIRARPEQPPPGGAGVAALPLSQRPLIAPTHLTAVVTTPAAANCPIWNYATAAAPAAKTPSGAAKNTGLSNLPRRWILAPASVAIRAV